MRETPVDCALIHGIVGIATWAAEQVYSYRHKVIPVLVLEKGLKSSAAGAEPVVTQDPLNSRGDADGCRFPSGLVIPVDTARIHGAAANVRSCPKVRNTE